MMQNMRKAPRRKVDSLLREIDELKRTQTFLSEAQRLSSTGSFMWKDTSDQVCWSEETYRIFEIEPATPLTHEVILARIHPEDAALVRGNLEQHRCGGAESDFEFRLLLPDRSVKYLRVLSHSNVDEQGHVTCTGAIQDLTQR